MIRGFYYDLDGWTERSAALRALDIVYREYKRGKHVTTGGGNHRQYWKGRKYTEVYPTYEAYIDACDHFVWLYGLSRATFNWYMSENPRHDPQPQEETAPMEAEQLTMNFDDPPPVVIPSPIQRDYTERVLDEEALIIFTAQYEDGERDDPRPAFQAKWKERTGEGKTFTHEAYKNLLHLLIRHSVFYGNVAA